MDNNEFVEIQRRVEWMDTDAAGRHHNTSIIRWAEAAEAELMRKLDTSELASDAPRVRQEINFRGMLYFDQWVRTRLWVERIGRSSLTVGFVMHGWQEDTQEWQAAADGLVITVCIDRDSNQSMPWPQSFREALQPWVRAD